MQTRSSSRLATKRPAQQQPLAKKNSTNPLKTQTKQLLQTDEQKENTPNPPGHHPRSLVSSSDMKNPSGTSRYLTRSKSAPPGLRSTRIPTRSASAANRRVQWDLSHARSPSSSSSGGAVNTLKRIGSILKVKHAPKGAVTGKELTDKNTKLNTKEKPKTRQTRNSKGRRVLDIITGPLQRLTRSGRKMGVTTETIQPEVQPEAPKTRSSSRLKMQLSKAAAKIKVAMAALKRTRSAKSKNGKKNPQETTTTKRDELNPLTSTDKAKKKPGDVKAAVTTKGASKRKATDLTTTDSPRKKRRIVR